MTTKTHIAISVALQNTGQATRALELAKGLQDNTPTGHEIIITFLSHGSWFEPYIREAGFDIIHVQPEVEGRSTDDDMGFYTLSSLPAGVVQVRASYGGRTQTHTIDVSARMTYLPFVF